MIINYMNLLRLISLIFIWITPVYGNSIYNLIKIPNLEIYEINTKNKLKYFYAKNSFRLGVQKNIICENSKKNDLDNKFKVSEAEQLYAERKQEEAYDASSANSFFTNLKRKYRDSSDREFNDIETLKERIVELEEDLMNE